MDDLRDRAVASVLGLAIGDALGAPFEPSGPRRSPARARVRAAVDGLAARHVTDDTAMARNLWSA
jgi:ADP-ribosylglycohydrolase